MGGNISRLYIEDAGYQADLADASGHKSRQDAIKLTPERVLAGSAN